MYQTFFSIIQMAKGVSLFILLILSSYALKGQVFTALYDSSLVHFDEPLVSPLSLENIVFRGIDNPFILNTSLFPRGVDSITANGQYLCEPNGSLIYHWDGEREQDVLYINIWFGKTEPTIRKEFIIRPLPEASIYFGHTCISHTHILLKNDILSADSVYVLYGHEMSENGSWMKVDHYSIGYSYGNYYITKENSGNKVENSVRNLLLGMRPGQEISLRLLLQGLGSMEKEVSDLRFRVY